MGQKDKYGYKHNDGHYSKMTGSKINSSYSIYDKSPAKKDHSATHVNINTSNKTGSIVEHGSDGKSTKTDIKCFLTTACMRFLENFDDDCYELTILRNFRDNFVSEEEIYHYYSVAPYIVEGINKAENNEAIYKFIYKNVIQYCVNEILNGNYDKAYLKYKETILKFEVIFAKPILEQQLTTILKRKLERKVI